MYEFSWEQILVMSGGWGGGGCAEPKHIYMTSHQSRINPCIYIYIYIYIYNRVIRDYKQGLCGHSEYLISLTLQAG